MDKEILDITGVSKLLEVSKYTIYKLVKVNKLPAIKVGRKWRFHRETIVEWIASGSNTNQIEQIIKSKNVRFGKI